MNARAHPLVALREAEDPPEPRWLAQDAELSPCGRYRYRLTRVWDRARPRCLWVMLNPSAADAERLDPTTRRCFAFSASWGCGGLEVANLFALRSSDPAALYREPPVDAPGEEGRNDRTLLALAREADLVVAAWGAHGRLAGRGEEVARLLARAGPVHVVRFTADGSPGHPLYLPASATPQLWLGGTGE
ncbi:DUF1643 domain-containing protein [Anaeromyxobacter paludicola]|uniref:DUF1643 domain-containing protein n=1 Tax=Anaeromyxobacter paludicola TaxID=2918171 RepID=A0ABM7XAE4_9BACT|nr:DUF1643 domain-containing protein [Anaeromyxobacter paludicola]BDG08820.1 hypothetical protein AMPC_19330 [Anaeromyxobacter paludicola]